MLVRLSQNDVVYRRHLDRSHRAHVPDFGVFIKLQAGDKVEYRAISRQLVLFCVERRKAWRLLQSKAGIENREYKAQRSILADVDAGRISKQELFARAEELMQERLHPAAPSAPSSGAPESVPVPLLARGPD
jgi:pyruvate-ferredoxin/flavodoxin oxidoreductase